MAAAPINRRTKLARGEPELIERLARSDQLVYSPHQLTELFRAMRERGIYSKQASYEDFLGFVLRRGHLTQIALTAPHYDETLLRFCRGQAGALDIAATLRSSAYFSHSTAAYLNGLTTTVPNALYLNLEQSAKPKSTGGTLSQESLDRAFTSTQRQSKLFYTYEKLTVTMLSGKKTASQCRVRSSSCPGTLLLKVILEPSGNLLPSQPPGKAGGSIPSLLTTNARGGQTLAQTGNHPYSGEHSSYSAAAPPRAL